MMANIKSNSAVFVTLAFFTTYVPSNVMTSGTFYQKISDDNEDIDDGTPASVSSLFTRDFHQCSLQNRCNFVAVNTEDNTVHQLESKDNLKNIGNGKKMKIWQKAKDIPDPANENSEAEQDTFFIRHWGGLCVSLRASDNILYLNTSCDEKFTLTSTKALKHIPSGKCIASLGTNGTPLSLTSSCNDANARFEQTASFSMKHISSGFCVHPKGGAAFPAIGTKIVLWESCGESNNRTHFKFIYAGQK